MASIRKNIKNYKKNTDDTKEVVAIRIKKYRNYMKFDFGGAENGHEYV